METTCYILHWTLPNNKVCYRLRPVDMAYSDSIVLSVMPANMNRIKSKDF